MSRPNQYNSEKRRKELEKKRKKEEKLQRRAELKNHPPGEDSETSDQEQPSDGETGTEAGTEAGQP